MTIQLLVVDDSEPLRRALRAMLSHAASVREAATLAQAMESVRLDPPTLLILDQHLPDGLGMNTIQPLKQLAPPLLIAMFSLDADSELRNRCLELGADWFFDKSTEIASLRDLVMQLAAEYPEGCAERSGAMSTNDQLTN